MTPYYADPFVTLHQGDVREVLRSFPADSVQTCVTSPPYWSLRDYGIPPSVWGGAEDCEHEWESAGSGEGFTGTTRWQHTTNGRGEEQPDEKRLRTSTTRETRPEAWGEVRQGDTCAHCGAWRGALGLEPTPDLFVAHIVEVFREVRRVLRPDGTLWLNLGDSYASGGRTSYDEDAKSAGRGGAFRPGSGRADGVVDERGQRNRNGTPVPPGIKPKDLVGIPWMVAFALRADGWYLRQDIIWAKPNPMPESVRDRCTKAHEYLFLLSKSGRYYYDADAIKEQASSDTHARTRKLRATGEETSAPTKERNGIRPPGVGPKGAPAGSGVRYNESFSAAVTQFLDDRNKRSVWSIPTAPFPEAHFATFPPDLVRPCVLAGAPEGSTVLDPFVGSGTTAMVAKQLGRKAIGIDLNPEYLAMAEGRMQAVTLPFSFAQPPCEIVAEPGAAVTGGSR